MYMTNQWIIALLHPVYRKIKNLWNKGHVAISVWNYANRIEKGEGNKSKQSADTEVYLGLIIHFPFINSIFASLPRISEKLFTYVPRLHKEIERPSQFSDEVNKNKFGSQFEYKNRYIRILWKLKIFALIFGF